MLLVFLLLILPFFSTLTGLIFYRFQGKKDIFKIDIVQFYYTFIVWPIIFVWAKTMIFWILQANTHLVSTKEIYTIDTAYSVVFMVIYAFIAMHSLTKTFHLKEKDPLYNFFIDSEYIHLWLSHIAMVLGGGIIATTIAFINLWFPIEWLASSSVVIWLMILFFIMGFFIYLIIELTDPKQEKRFTYMRIVKLMFGFILTLHIIFFAIKTPDISSQYVVFWSSFMMFFGASILGFTTYRSARFKQWLNGLVKKKMIYKNKGWGENIALFNHRDFEKKRQSN